MTKLSRLLSLLCSLSLSLLSNCSVFCPFFKKKKTNKNFISVLSERCLFKEKKSHDELCDLRLETLGSHNKTVNKNGLVSFTFWMLRTCGEEGFIYKTFCSCLALLVYEGRCHKPMNTDCLYTRMPYNLARKGRKETLTFLFIFCPDWTWSVVGVNEHK